MTQTTYEIGARVVRVAGGPGYMGKRGEVVEAKENRVRVKWDDE
jgi:membrane protein implicated in regulation of membrane protease activity